MIFTHDNKSKKIEFKNGQSRSGEYFAKAKSLGGAFVKIQKEKKKGGNWKGQWEFRGNIIKHENQRA